MVRAKFTRKGQQADLPIGGLLQLQCGRDFFDNGFGDDVDAMRAAWADGDVRRRVWAAHQARWGDCGCPWAVIAFGRDGSGGMLQTANNIPESQSLYWEGTHPEQARKAVEWAYSVGRIDRAEYDEHMARLGK